MRGSLTATAEHRPLAIPAATPTVMEHTAGTAAPGRSAPEIPGGTGTATEGIAEAATAGDPAGQAQQVARTPAVAAAMATMGMTAATATAVAMAAETAVTAEGKRPDLKPRRTRRERFRPGPRLLLVAQHPHIVSLRTGSQEQRMAVGYR